MDEDDAMEDDGPSHVLAEATTIRLTCAPAISALSFWVARDTGILESRNLSTECVQIGSGPETAAAMIAGEVEIASNIYNNVIPLVDSGLDVVAFHQVQDAQLFDIVVSNEIEIPDGASWDEVMALLDGTNVGVVARGAAAEDVARILVEEAGLDPENQTYIAVGLDSVTPMVGGEIQWTVTFDPNITLAVLNGVGTRPFQIQLDEGPPGLNWPGLATTASRAWIDANQDIACAWSESLNDAVRYLNDPANFDEVVQIASDNLPFDNPEAIEVLVDNYRTLMSPDGEIDTAIISSIGELSQSLGKSESLIGPDDFVYDLAC